MNRPAISQVVHYVLRSEDSYCAGEHRPALITGVIAGADGEVLANLMVTLDPANDNRGLGADGLEPPKYHESRTRLDRYGVPYSQGKEPGTWHWPEPEPEPPSRKPTEKGMVWKGL